MKEKYLIKSWQEINHKTSLLETSLYKHYTNKTQLIVFLHILKTVAQQRYLRESPVTLLAKSSRALPPGPFILIYLKISL